MHLSPKIKVWLNNHIWPFTTISNLKADLDEAKYNERQATFALCEYIDYDISNTEFSYLDILPGKPIHKFDITTGISEPYNIQEYGREVRGTVDIITPKPYNVGVIYPTYLTPRENREYFAREMAGHISQQLYNEMYEGILNGKLCYASR